MNKTFGMGGLSPRFRLDGVQPLRQRLARLVQEVPLAVGRALTEEAEIELKESKRRVPVDTGALRASGHVTEVDYSGGRTSIDIVYGGASEDYAERVHEDLEAFHPVGQAKYLESVLVESAPHMPSRLARRLNIEELAR